MEQNQASIKIDPTTIVYQVLVGLIASVWLINGLFCKVLEMVPRHQQIVSGILGEQYSGLITKLIGVAETAFACWVVSCYRPRLAALLQIIIITGMNVLEFFLVPELLLWGRTNLLFAMMLVLLIVYTEFVLRPRAIPPST